MEVVVFGLVDFKKAFRARQQAEKVRIDDPSKYPGSDSVYRAWPSVHPDYQRLTARLARTTNEHLQTIESRIDRRAGNLSAGLVRIGYSPVLFERDMSRENYFHPFDALHPSREAHVDIAHRVEAVRLPGISRLLEPGPGE